MYLATIRHPSLATSRLVLSKLELKKNLLLNYFFFQVGCSRLRQKKVSDESTIFTETKSITSPLLRSRLSPR